MRTTVNLPEPLLENAKRFAEERGMTLSGLLEDALRQRMAERAPMAAEPFRLHTVRGKALDPGIDLDRTSALITEDDEAAYRGGK
jgi:hypothetical protein